MACNCFACYDLFAQNTYLREEIDSEHDFGEIAGQSECLQTVLASIRRVAATNASVLIRGETAPGRS